MKKQKEILSYEEDRLNRVGRRRHRGKSIAIVLGLLTAMAAVMCLTSVICVWIDNKMQKDAYDAAIALGLKDENGKDIDPNAVNVSSGSVVYSEAELESRVSEAVSKAVTEAVAAARQQATDEVRNAIKGSLDEGDSLLQALRPLYPDDILVYSDIYSDIYGDKKYHFVPINRELKLNDFVTENLNILESGEYQYLKDGQVISHKGIDVSQYQGNIDWKKVAEDGVEFAFIRAGYRGYGRTGKLVEDANFDKNIKGAVSNGIKVGVYFYSQATTEEEAIEEANLVLSKIAPYKVECPVVFDVEKVTADPNARMNLISLEKRTNLALLFCQTIENAGYKPMIYYNTEMGALMLDLETLEGYDKWFAAYSDRFYYPYAYQVWQYSQTGRVAGIEGAVDLDISFVPLWEE